jgi:hypothetical protein
MNPEADRLEAARKSGEQYGTGAADLCLILLSTAPGEEAIEEHIKNLARNSREQAGAHARGVVHIYRDVLASINRKPGMH